PQPRLRPDTDRSARVESDRVAVILLVGGDEDVSVFVERDPRLVAAARLEGRQPHRRSERRGGARGNSRWTAGHQEQEEHAGRSGCPTNTTDSWGHTHIHTPGSPRILQPRTWGPKNRI